MLQNIGGGKTRYNPFVFPHHPHTSCPFSDHPRERRRGGRHRGRRGRVPGDRRHRVVLSRQESQTHRKLRVTKIFCDLLLC